jgi:poly-gamma-glutamate synthesis protein (capsule biosynthesis protein)
VQSTNQSTVQNTQQDQSLLPISATEFVDPQSVQADLAFFGDVFWGRYINDWSLASTEQYNYPFQSFDTIDKRPGEYWVANLECPITDQNLDSRTQENLLKFNCGPEYLPFAKPWFDALSLANNHTDNMEEFDGYNSTQEYLTQSGITPFGHFDNELANLCTVVAVPAKGYYGEMLNAQDLNSNKEARFSSHIMPVALCGFHSIFRLLTTDEIAYIDNFARYIPTISMPHSGEEYVEKPDQIKTQAYRDMIDAGSDMVIGGHPHSVQSTEVYQDKLIAYSLGNFVFDQQFSQQVMTHLGLRSSVTVNFGDAVESWQSLPSSCFNTSVVCPQIKALPAKPALNIKYEPIYTSNRNKLTVAANQADTAYIKKLSNIESTLTVLNK